MKNPALLKLIRLLLLLCVAAPLAAFAAPAPVATVVAVRGTVTAQSAASAERPLAIKSPVYQSDILKTGSNGRLQIMFTDNSIISLGGGSEMKIAEYRWQPGQKDGALKTRIKEGTFRVMGGALAKDAPQNFKTETPTATIGIRGSMYAGVTTPNTLSVVFQGGKGIEVYNERGKITITVPGFGSRVALNAAPEPPHRFTQQELKNLNSQLNGNGQTSGTGGGAAGTSAGTNNGETGSSTTTALLPAQPTVPPTPELPPVNEYLTAPNFTLPPPPPSDGIYAFDGGVGGYSTLYGMTTVSNTINNAMTFGVNWHNGRMFGIAYDDTTSNGNPVFFFGTLSGATLSNLTIFGADQFSYNNEPSFISGSGAGVFTGTNYDFFAFSATGSTYGISSGLPHDSWVVAGGGQQVTGAMTAVAPTGTETWQGFATGLSTNLAYPYSNPGIFQSSAPNLSMTVNKDAGTISGALTTDINHTATSLQVGGSTANSVYLRDDLLAALISGTPLKSYGNFMVVADPSQQFSSYCTWGYWEIAYTESGTDRIMAAPYSMWIAGNPTPASVIGDLARSNFVGEYNGGARGTQFSASGATTLTGTSYLRADFSAATVSGNITFPNVITLPISSGSINNASSSFTGTISNAPTTPSISGSANGMFFGPQANAVGGSFSASNTATSSQYLGVFGGNR